MSNFDNEIISLQNRIAELENLKKKEQEVSIDNFKVLDEFIEEKKKKIKQDRYCKSIRLARFYDEEKVKYLEAIFNILNEIDSRLKKLE
jgi:acetyl-CoA carboxylase alpha subunit